MVRLPKLLPWLTTFLTKSAVAHAEPETPEESQWHLFNDFSVKQVSTAEALTFNTRWKMPSMLVYQLKTANNKLDSEWVKDIDTSVLHIDFKYVLVYLRFDDGVVANNIQT